MKQDELLHHLCSVQDLDYRQMMVRLVPNIDAETILGVRTPELRAIAGQLEDRELFCRTLPHRYFEENQLHSLILSQERDFESAVSKVEDFLPFVDNWATCDQLRPRAFAKKPSQLLPHIYRWLASTHPYTIRFAVEMLMCHYLEDAFDPAYPALVAGVHHSDYYVKMMVAWYFATALAKQYDAVVPYLRENRLEKWEHNKAIQKAVESRRIPLERKELLKKYRI